MSKHTPEFTQPQLPFDEIEYGYCHCGCGQKTSIADRNSKRNGWTKGEPLRYILGHQWAGRRKQIELANPSGLCLCGCGQTTSIAVNSNTLLGHIKGQPMTFVHGHNGRKFPMPEPPNPSGLCMCGCGMPTGIAKETDGRAGIGKGQHYRYYGGHYEKRTVEERFWEKVDECGPDECWVWLGSTNPAGYGLIHSETNSLAHRVSWEIHNGPIPEGMFICHHCDNPPCCNPQHLFLGTRQDNIDDMMSKGRNNRTIYAYGEKAPGAKLKLEQVLEIRKRYANGEHQTHIAIDYGVSQTTVWAIVSGKTWQHI